MRCKTKEILYPLFIKSYNRDCDEVDGKRAYHNGISCVMTSPPGGIDKDDLECSVSDEDDAIIHVLEPYEKPVSSMIEIKSTKETVTTEVCFKYHNDSLKISLYLQNDTDKLS